MMMPGVASEKDRGVQYEAALERLSRARAVAAGSHLVSGGAGGLCRSRSVCVVRLPTCARGAPHDDIVALSHTRPHYLKPATETSIDHGTVT